MAKPSTLAFVQQSLALHDAGRSDEAMARLNRLLMDRPKDILGLMGMARVLNRVGRPAQALTYGEKLLKLAPQLADTHQELAESHCRLRQFDEALKHAKRGMAIAPRNPDMLYVAATVYERLERYEDAIACIKTALKIRPRHMQSRLLLASNLRSAGKLEECATLCREIFAEDPDNFFVQNIYNRAVKFTEDDPIFLYLRDVMVPAVRKAGGQYHGPLLKFLAKAEDDLGHYDLAIQLFAEAKEADGKKHEGPAYLRFVNDMTGMTRADFFGRIGAEGETPVFIVGLPRCGSTLLEQILSSHPRIDGIGESGLMRGIRDHLRVGDNEGAKLVEAIRGLTPAKAQEAGGHYLQKSNEAANGALRIVDKNLHNFELLGLAARILPGVRVLHATRDPMDHCVSMYMQPLNDWHSYTQDFTSLGRYFIQYRRLMEHWSKVLPIPIMEVPYEQVVADTEGMARKVIDFLGLPWDDACLDFQKNEKRVKTLSVAQVRQPVYTTSVKRWKRYEAALDPLKEELKGFYPDGF
ncbi:MAG: tetratricopeptide repeat protein [Limimaricola sp.]|uniref:tetratricopeptide repeat-containing sulfotransferase family protein n=1 Tax=Limimaricola sp. TaxID=2211665 RepID=UPI001D5F39FC|nr:tetratricopeptide repeat-containing sulfotransferase family protein [Limimaricola sp.]MBI1416109.1 tetratricopeptide repeat protein [Limimaricola sp.]